jgi:hypothetical protein
VLTSALGTYVAAIVVIGASTALGAGVLAACGRRTWSWTAPAVGLAAATVIAWWAIRLPGHGWTALAALAVLSAAGVALAAARLEGLGAVWRDGARVVIGALLIGSIPFIVEGHFGVLGSGFNVDMSQHLFAADWLSDPSGTAPGLYAQGYPLGPHALAAATGELSGELTTAFSGVTVALPAIAALTALSGLGAWPRWRAFAAGLLTAFAYLVASYLAQGSFKELFEVVFLLGVALLLAERRTASATLPAGGWRDGIPIAVIGAGALYAYSAPGLAWLVGAVVVWAVLELARDRTVLRPALPAVTAALIALLLIAAPELDRIIDFGGSVGTVSESARSDAGARPALLAANGSSDGGRRVVDGPKFDNDLGNLFGQISPLEALNVWPSGDFRVAPGDGAIPAPVFFLGALLGALALAIGAPAAWRRGEGALLAALAAAAAIWLAARIGSTPYTTAKALALIAPMTMIISARGLLAPAAAGSPRFRLPLAALVAAFSGAAALSSGLALANAPVGPTDYTPGVRELSQRFAGRPTLLLAPDDVIADQHGAAFYAWEMREADPACVEPVSAAGPFSGIRLVLTVDGVAPPAGAEPVADVDGANLWRLPRVAGDVTGGRNGACEFAPGP